MPAWKWSTNSSSSSFASTSTSCPSSISFSVDMAEKDSLLEKEKPSPFAISSEAPHHRPPPPPLPPHAPLRLHQTFRRLGPIIQLQLSQIPTIVLSSPRLLRDVFKTHDLTFSNHPQPVSAPYLSFGCTDITFFPYSAYWRQVRKICVTELLSSRRVHSIKLVRHQEMTRLLQSVPPHSSPTNMSERFFTLANDILYRVAFGRRFAEGAGGGETQHGLKLNEVLAETGSVGRLQRGRFLSWVGVGEPGEWIEGEAGEEYGDLRIVCDEIIKKHVLRIADVDDEEEDGLEKMRGRIPWMFCCGCGRAAIWICLSPTIISKYGCNSSRVVPGFVKS